MASGWGNSVNSDRLYFLGSQINTDGDCSHDTKRHLLFERKVMTKLDSILKSRDIILTTKVHIVKAMVFPVHARLWELDCKEGRSRKNRCLQTVELETTSESSLDSKEIKPVNLKGNQPWILIGRTDAGAETPVFWSSDENSWLIGKFPDAGKDWRQKEKRASVDEIAGWHHRCNEHELGQTSGGGEGQRPGVLQSKGSQRVGLDWVTKHSTHTHICKY